MCACGFMEICVWAEMVWSVCMSASVCEQLPKIYVALLLKKEKKKKKIQTCVLVISLLALKMLFVNDLTQVHEGLQTSDTFDVCLASRVTVLCAASSLSSEATAACSCFQLSATWSSYSTDLHAVHQQ